MHKCLRGHRICQKDAEEDTFVPERGIFLGETVAGGALCPQMKSVFGRECCAGAMRTILSTKKVSFVDAEGKCSRLSTQRVLGVDAGCHVGTFGA